MYFSSLFVSACLASSYVTTAVVIGSHLEATFIEAGIKNLSNVDTSNYTAFPFSEPECYYTDHGTKEIDLDQCIQAATEIRLDKDFRTMSWYGRICLTKVPLTWEGNPEEANNCFITLDVYPTTNLDQFSLEEIFEAIPEIIVKCVKRKPEGAKFGGRSEVGNGQGFFFTVQGWKLNVEANDNIS